MSKESLHIKEILQRIPNQPGVYQYRDAEGTIIYVGKAKNLHRRVNSYFQKEYDSSKTRQLVAHIADIKYVVVESEQDAFLLENNLIKQYQPRYNILLKDGKSYPCICITREPYPRILKTRQIEKKNGEYFGPFSFCNSVDLIIKLVHTLFPIRTCTMPILPNIVEQGKYKVCLKYHIKNCCGICEGYKKKEYKKWIDQAKKIIQGDTREIIEDLKKQMAEYAQKMEYEQANEVKRKLELLIQYCSKTIISNTTAGDVDVFGYEESDDNIYISMLHVHNGCIVQGQTIEYKRQLDENKEEILAQGILELREQLGSKTREIIVPFIPDVFDEKIHIHIAINGDKKKLLDLAMQNVHQYKRDRMIQTDKLNPDQRAIKVLKELQKMLNLPRTPMWIDSFDNSSIQGTYAVSACVVFKKGKATKSDYKKYEVKTVEGTDDYATMREIINRRYSRLLNEQSPLPDLIIADGGEGQMKAIEEVIQNQLLIDIPVVGLKKNDKHKTQTLLYGHPAQEVSMPITSDVFRLLAKIQDEVHRVAISYHKKKRSKAQISSYLDDIQGVGIVTKQKILLHFGSVERARMAEKEEWIKLLGNNRGSAIYEQIKHKISR